MTRKLRWFAVLAAFPLAVSAQQQPAPPPANPTAHRHLGFALRLELGYAYDSMSTDISGLGTLKLSGGGAGFAVAVGGAISENFVLGFQAWDGIASKPTVELTGAGSATANGSAAVVGYGLLLNWYLQPSNVYLYATPSATRLALTNDSGGATANSEWGFGLRLGVGKEWWVSDHWGLGVTAWYAYSSNKDSSASGAPTWTTNAFGVNFSATYN